MSSSRSQSSGSDSASGSGSGSGSQDSDDQEMPPSQNEQLYLGAAFLVGGALIIGGAAASGVLDSEPPPPKTAKRPPGLPSIGVKCEGYGTQQTCVPTHWGVPMDRDLSPRANAINDRPVLGGACDGPLISSVAACWFHCRVGRTSSRRFPLAKVAAFL
eukprot:TRINITY_DN46320_c0_g1_i1.p1 TRINITY_DN46320_c0_g1~~TRINITY_DN46320_c0_g1_i1.p1  ORF type:complete len:159 (+),score=9.52 TRINITY_DN46320_c0_g1_i1:92-568(+)